MSNEEKLLNRLIKIYNLNPNLFTKNVVYGELVKYGVIEEEKNLSIYSMFKDLKESFSHVENINVVYDANYCTIHDKFMPLKNNIVMHIPLSSTNIKNGVNSLFRYLSMKKINYYATISSEIRNDNISITLENSQDANLVNEYIKNNMFFQNDYLKPTPFMAKDGKSSFAMEENKSYLDSISSLIYDFVKKYGKTYNGANSVENFSKYINDSITNVYLYNNQKSLNEFSGVLEIDNNNAHEINNASYTLSYISDVLNKNMNLDQFHEMFNDTQDKSIINIEDKKIADKLVMNEDISDEKMLISACLSTFNEYGPRQLSAALKIYITTGDAKSFTRKNNARENILRFLTPEKVKDLITKKIGSLNVDEFINSIQEKSVDKFNVFLNGCIATYLKDGRGALQLNGAIRMVLMNNDYHGFVTMCRDEVSKIKPEEMNVIIDEIISHNGYMAQNDEDNVKTFVRFIEDTINLNQSNSNEQKR